MNSREGGSLTRRLGGRDEGGGKLGNEAVGGKQEEKR